MNVILLQDVVVDSVRLHDDFSFCLVSAQKLVCVSLLFRQVFCVTGFVPECDSRFAMTGIAMVFVNNALSISAAKGVSTNLEITICGMAVRT